MQSHIEDLLKEGHSIAIAESVSGEEYIEEDHRQYIDQYLVSLQEKINNILEDTEVKHHVKISEINALMERYEKSESEINDPITQLSIKLKELRG